MSLAADTVLNITVRELCKWNPLDTCKSFGCSHVPFGRPVQVRLEAPLNSRRGWASDARPKRTPEVGGKQHQVTCSPGMRLCLCRSFVRPRYVVRPVMQFSEVAAESVAVLVPFTAFPEPAGASTSLVKATRYDNITRENILVVEIERSLKEGRVALVLVGWCYYF
jgi:hypothetical protein